MQDMRILLFGGMRLLDRQGADVALTHGSRLLLAMLAASEGPAVDRSALAAAFWPGVEASAARRGLEVELAGLARGLAAAGLRPSAVFEDRRDEVALQPEVWCDAVVFDAFYEDLPLPPGPGSRPLDNDEAAALGVAVGLVTGPVLAGFDDPWSEEIRRGFDGRIDHAVKALLHAAERQERWDDAAAWAERLLGADPLSEPATRALMRCCWAAGDVRSALRHYRRLSDALRDRLDARPERETVGLRDWIIIDSTRRTGRAGPAVPTHRPNDTWPS